MRKLSHREVSHLSGAIQLVRTAGSEFRVPCFLVNSIHCSFTVTLIFALAALNFYLIRLWADAIMPEIITLGKIACFPRLFAYAPLRIDIFPAPEPGKKVSGSIFRYVNWKKATIFCPYFFQTLNPFIPLKRCR